MNLLQHVHTYHVSVDAYMEGGTGCIGGKALQELCE
jgi:hypothetical protein